MQGMRAGVVGQAWGRARRITKRAGERVRSWPTRLAQHRAGLPVPPSPLLYLVAGTEDVGWFLESGRAGADCLADVLARNGLDLKSQRSILDFGCGVGRVIRHLGNLRHVQLHGTDYNPRLIAWCRQNLPFARFGLNGLDRRLDYEDEAFDFIYTLSVFTHLSEALQFHWIGELARLLRPGGHLFLTVHGESYCDLLDPASAACFRSGQLVVRDAGREGRNDCAAFHPERYVRQTLARGLEVIDFLPMGARGNPHQDVYLLRKPAARA